MRRPIRIISIIFLLWTMVYGLWTVSEAQASIILKLIAANPSKTQSQMISIKTYLPKETKPEDILDKADLEVAYDTQQGSYFVYGDFNLEPGELLEKDVELVDIWNVSASEIESLRSETAQLKDLLSKTEFAERADFLKESIESKLARIVENQLNAPANPERHISDYREHLRILESAKEDMLLARSLLSEAKSFPTVVVWRLIIGIIIFLGILGISFYFIWHKQLKSITDTMPEAKEEPSVAEGAQEAPPEAEAGGEKKTEADDIEKIIKEEES